MDDLRKAAEMVVEVYDNDYGEIAKKIALSELRQALAHPQQKREWVGLTDEEKGWCAAPTYEETVNRTEAKLKEKNCGRF